MAEWPYSTATWKALRRTKLQASPLCETCDRLGLITVANTVDHIVSINSGGDPFPPREGLASMCAQCHRDKTNAVDRPDRRPGHGVARGCGVDGLPLDPDHPFTAEGDTPVRGRGAIQSETGGASKTHLVQERDYSSWG